MRERSNREESSKKNLEKALTVALVTAAIATAFVVDANNNHESACDIFRNQPVCMIQPEPTATSSQR